MENNLMRGGSLHGSRLSLPSTLVNMLSMGPVFDLDRLKSAFTSLVTQAEPDILPAFMLWVDLKVSEFKVKGTPPPPSIETKEAKLTKDAWVSNRGNVHIKENNTRDRCNNIDSYEHDVRMNTSSPQDLVTDLSMKTALKATVMHEEQHKKSLKSVIDNIVKTETLADRPSLPLPLSQSLPPHTMHLPVTLPFLPPGGTALAHTHFNLAKMLSQAPPLLPQTPYGDIPELTKTGKHSLSEAEIEKSSHKRICRSDVALPSEEAVCLKKSIRDTPPTMSVAQEASCYPQPEASPVMAASQYESGYSRHDGSYSQYESSYPQQESSYTAPPPYENNSYLENNMAPSPQKQDHCEKENRKSESSPSKSRVTSALRELLTSKLSSQFSNHEDEVLSPEPSDKLIIDEDRASMSDSEMGVHSPHQTMEDEVKHPNKCHVCGQMFQYRSSFRRHMKVHQGIFSHVCAVCGRKFTRKEHFIRHKCSRKPNKASRGAHSEITGNGAVVPKVEFPPLQAGQSPSHRSEVSQDGSHSEFTDLPNSPAKVPAQAPCESRRKAAVPRKVVMVEENERPEESFEEDQVANQEYEPKVQTPGYIAASSPMSMDLSQASPAKSDVRSVTPELSCTPDMYYSPRKECPAQSYECDEALDLSCPQVTSSSPIKDASTPLNLTNASSQAAPIPTQQEFTIDTGSYKVVTSTDPQGEGGDRTNQFIKVVKQGNYLRLKEEAQVIAGQLCFVCPTCGKVFHRSSNFSRHMRIHRGVYSYVCPNCQRGFFRREHFQKHKCSRRGMSHTWDRKTKIDMVLAANGGQEGSDAEGGSESEESYPGATEDIHHHDDHDLVIPEGRDSCSSA